MIINIEKKEESNEERIGLKKVALYHWKLAKALSLHLGLETRDNF